MDDSLQRLLDAEMRAEKIAQHAETERERIIQGALAETRAEEERFEKRTPELHASFVDKADSRAEQTIAELKRRYDERHVQLRELAEQREDDALEAAFAILIGPDMDPAQTEGQ
jgi:predicted metalloendopeptidase